MDNKQRILIGLDELRAIMLNENSPNGARICKEAMDYISNLIEAPVSPTEPNDGAIKRFISSQKQLDPDILKLLNEFDELTGKRKPSRDRFF
jgi:hypothetical protein